MINLIEPNLIDEVRDLIAELTGSPCAVITSRQEVLLNAIVFLAEIAGVRGHRGEGVYNRNLALRDLPTGSPIRTRLNERVSRFLLSSGASAIARICADLDRFTSGHRAGDGLACQLARLDAVSPTADTPAVTDGEEIALLLHDMIMEFHAADVCHRRLVAAAAYARSADLSP